MTQSLSLTVHGEAKELVRILEVLEGFEFNGESWESDAPQTETALVIGDKVEQIESDAPTPEDVREAMMAAHERLGANDAASEAILKLLATHNAKKIADLAPLTYRAVIQKLESL